MQKIIKIIIADILIMSLLLLNVPFTKVFGKTVENVIISISVVDKLNTVVENAVIKVNGKTADTLYSDYKYLLDISEYKTENLEITVYSKDETISKDVSYVKDITDYEVVLAKDLIIGNEEAEYDDIRKVYDITIPYSSKNEYILYVSETGTQEKNEGISFLRESMEDKSCDGVKLEANNNGNGIKIKYTSPGNIRIKCSSINNSLVYNDAVIELHVTNTLSYKYGENSNLDNKYEVSEKDDSGEVDTVTINAANIGDNASIDITLNLSADYMGDVEYSVTNGDSFTVDTSGTVTCTKPGNTTVTALSVKTGETASYDINIVAESSEVQIYNVNEEGRTLISSNGKYEVDVLDYYNGPTLNIEGIVKNSEAWAYNNIIYSSDDSNVASISEDGKITVNGVGSTTITASAESNSIWWNNISSGFTLTVKPASMNIVVKYNKDILEKDDVLELSDASQNKYMKYDNSGNGTSFTLPIDINVYDIDGNEIQTGIKITSDLLDIEGLQVNKPDDIERNVVREYKITTSPSGIYGRTEYILKIKLMGEQDNNDGYYTVTSGLIIGADGNLWAESENVPVVLNGETIYLEGGEPQSIYTYTMTDNFFDQLSYVTPYSIAVSSEVQPINKQHLFYVMDENRDYITQRLYFGADFGMPVIEAVTTTANVTSFGIYDRNSISVTINAKDNEGNLYEAYVTDTSDYSKVKIERFTIDNTDSTSGFVTFTFDKDTYLNKSERYNIYIVDRAGNKSEEIPLNTALNNTLKDMPPTAENGEVTDNELLMEEESPEVFFDLNEASDATNKYTDERGNHYFDKDVVIDINVCDKGDGEGNENVSGIAGFTVEVYTGGSLVDTKTYDFTYESIKRNSYTLSINTKDYKVGEDGAVTIVVKDIKDNAQNVSVGKTYNAYIDREAPLVTIKNVVTDGAENIKEYGSYYNKSVYITMELDDKISGTATAILNIGGKEYPGNIISKADGKSEVTYKISNGIGGNVSLYVKDKVEHSRTYNLNEIKTTEGLSKYISRYIVVEDSNPVVNIDEERLPDTGGKWYNHSIALGISVAETGVVSGIQNIKIYINDLLHSDITYDEPGKSEYKTRHVIDENMVNRFVNEDGSYIIKAVATDNAGNEYFKEKTIYIDMTAPVISNLTGITEGSFNTGMVTVVATIDEKHFIENGNETTAEVTRTLDGETEKYTIKADVATSENNRYNFTFNKDGTYTIILNSKDAAGNKAASKTISFTIDNTSPICEITGVVENAYYKDTAYMTLSVLESNYATNKVDITITRELNGIEHEVSSNIFNSTDKNTTMQQSFSEEGTYTVKVDAKDEAGNTAVTRTVIFTVDTSDPVIEIKGVSNESAYKGDIIPEIAINDNYYKSYSIKLTKTGVYFNDSRTDINNLKDVDVTEDFIGGLAAAPNGIYASLDTFEKIQDNDGIYILTVMAEDLAGRIATKTVRFSVNRFGSVYTFDRNLTNILDTYNQSIDTDFVITEYNADKLIEDSVIIRIFRDGSPMDNIEVEATPQSKNAKAGETGWYQYTYKISAENFRLDGVYMITIASKDSAGNNSETLTYDELSVRFSVDTTKPQIVKIIGLNESSYNAESIDVTYEVFDAVSLKELRIYVADEEIVKISEFEDVTSYQGAFTIKEGIDQTVRFEVEDMAGNIVNSDSEEDTDSGNVVSFAKSVTVSTNLFIRWYSNRILFFGSITAVIVIAVAAIVLAIKSKKQKNI